MTGPTGTTQFTIDPNQNLSTTLMRTKFDGTTTYYVYGLGLLYEDTNGIMSSYHYNHLGSTVALTASDGVTVTDSFAYGTYGAVLAHSGSSDTPFLFAGEEGVATDSNNLNFMRARYYNPRVCRFLNADPLKFGGGSNWYAYAQNNPTGYNDPSGEFVGWDDAIVLTGGAVGGAVSQFVSNELTGHSGNYGSAIVGGAFTAEGTYLTGNPFIGGAVGGALSNIYKQEFETPGVRPFSWGQVIEASTVNGIGAGILSKIPGLTSAGRNSFDAINKQIVTKVANNTISRVSATTLSKITVNQVTQGVVPGFIDAANEKIELTIHTNK